MFWVRMHCGTYTVDVVPSHVGCWWMLDARAQRAQGTYEVVKNFLQDYWGTLAMPWGLRTTAIRCVLCHRWQVRRGRTESIRNGWIAEKFVRLHLSSPAAAGMIHLLIHYDSLWFTMIHYDSLWFTDCCILFCILSSFIHFVSRCPGSTNVLLRRLGSNSSGWMPMPTGALRRDAGGVTFEPGMLETHEKTHFNGKNICKHHWIALNIPIPILSSIFHLQNDVFQPLVSMSSGRNNFQHLSTSRSGESGESECTMFQPFGFGFRNIPRVVHRVACWQTWHQVSVADGSEFHRNGCRMVMPTKHNKTISVRRLERNHGSPIPREITSSRTLDVMVALPNKALMVWCEDRSSRSKSSGAFKSSTDDS